MSTLPDASICVYWVRALACSSVLAPPASMALLNARDISVASSRLPVNGASCCTIDVIELVVVGSPSSESLIFLTLAAASSELYPRFCMTLGKLFIWSARDTAPLMLLPTMSMALDVMALAAPMTAPVAPNPRAKPEPAFLPCSAPCVSEAEPNASAMDLPTFFIDGTIAT